MANREDWTPEGTTRMGGSLREFIVLRLDEEDALVTCRKCNGGAVVHYSSWVNQSSYKTRPCTYCFNTSKMPTEVLDAEGAVL